jgi:hypothetical protein
MPLSRHLTPSMLAAATGMLVAGAAHAESGLVLAWEAPLGCPTQGDVVAETRRLLGGQIPGDAALTARADVALVAPADYRLRIAIGPGTAERPREVHAPTCAELGDAAALLLALAIDPVAVASAPPGGALRSDRGAPPPPPRRSRSHPRCPRPSSFRRTERRRARLAPSRSTRGHPSRPVSAQEVSAQEVSARDVGAREVGAREVGARQRSAPEVSFRGASARPLSARPLPSPAPRARAVPS